MAVPAYPIHSTCLTGRNIGRKTPERWPKKTGVKGRTQKRGRLPLQTRSGPPHTAQSLLNSCSIHPGFRSLPTPDSHDLPESWQTRAAAHTIIYHCTSFGEWLAGFALETEIEGGTIHLGDDLETGLNRRRKQHELAKKRLLKLLH
jgi:hypothetical protein